MAARDPPESVFWENLSPKVPQFFTRVRDCAKTLVFAILCWATFIYGPYAYYEYQCFSSGVAPDSWTDHGFTIIIVAGNLSLYRLCDNLSDKSRPVSKDMRDCFYVVQFYVACRFNLTLDIVLLAWTSYKEMSWNGIRTSDGVLISKLDTLEKIIESYPLQKFLGTALFLNNISCFLLPFLFESATFLAPRFAGILGVRTRKIRFKEAVGLLKPERMDLGRYADLLLNFTLMITCFFFSSGWVLYSSALLVVGNAYVYVYDRWRSVRYMAAFTYGSNVVDHVAQLLLGEPCAVLAGALMYHLRLMRTFALGSDWTIFLVVLVMVTHILLHVCVMGVITRTVPLEPKEEESSDETYEDVEKRSMTTHTYFNSNVVHCLREKYVHGDKQATPFYAPYEVPVKKPR